jgi:hypothetical protein
MEEDIRNSHEQLLVGLADELRLHLHPVCPRLLDDLAARAAVRLVESGDLVKDDARVQRVLEGGRQVIRVIVGVVMVVAVTMAVTVVVVTTGILVLRTTLRHFAFGYLDNLVGCIVDGSKLMSLMSLTSCCVCVCADQMRCVDVDVCFTS